MKTDDLVKARRELQAAIDHRDNCQTKADIDAAEATIRVIGGMVERLEAERMAK